MHASCSDTGRVEHDSPKIWTPIVPIKMDPIVDIQALKRFVLGSMQYQHRIEHHAYLRPANIVKAPIRTPSNELAA